MPFPRDVLPPNDEAETVVALFRASSSTRIHVFVTCTDARRFQIRDADARAKVDSREIFSVERGLLDCKSLRDLGGGSGGG